MREKKSTARYYYYSYLNFDGFHSVTDAEIWISNKTGNVFMCVYMHLMYTNCVCVYKTTSNQLDLVIWKMKYTHTFTGAHIYIEEKRSDALIHPSISFE